MIHRNNLRTEPEVMEEVTVIRAEKALWYLMSNCQTAPRTAAMDTFH